MTVITTTDQLESLCTTLMKFPLIALDTEFIRVSTYYPELCLIQVKAGEHVGLIDVLSPNLDLAPLTPLLTNPNIVKILHSASQDCETLLHTLGCLPTPVFDTQIAYSFLHLNESIGYQQLTKDLIGVNLDKGQQYSEWKQRPLTESQLSYAALDVEYLEAIYIKLQKRLNNRNRLKWALDEMQYLSNPATFRVQPEEAYLRLKIKPHHPDLELIKALASYRETLAQSLNVTRRSLFDDPILLKLCKYRPSTIKALTSLQKFKSHRLDQDNLDQLLAIIQQYPTSQVKLRVNSHNGDLVSLLKLLLRELSIRESIAPSLIANSASLTSFAEGGDVSFLHGWRYIIFGKAACGIRDGEITLGFKDNQLAIIPTLESSP